VARVRRDQRRERRLFVTRVVSSKRGAPSPAARPSPAAALSVSSSARDEVDRGIAAGTCRYSTDHRQHRQVGLHRQQRLQRRRPARINRKQRRLVSDERTNNCPNVNNTHALEAPHMRTRHNLSNTSFSLHCLQQVFSHTHTHTHNQTGRYYV